MQTILMQFDSCFDDSVIIIRNNEDGKWFQKVGKNCCTTLFTSMVAGPLRNRNTTIILAHVQYNYILLYTYIQNLVHINFHVGVFFWIYIHCTLYINKKGELCRVLYKNRMLYVIF